MIAMRFLNASVLERKALNRNLSWGFPLGNLLPKTRVLKHRVLERKRRPNANASVLGTQRFRTRPLLRGRFGIEIGSNQELDVESMSNRCQIDAKSTPALSFLSLVFFFPWSFFVSFFPWCFVVFSLVFVFFLVFFFLGFLSVSVLFFQGLWCNLIKMHLCFIYSYI